MTTPSWKNMIHSPVTAATTMSREMTKQCFLANSRHSSEYAAGPPRNILSTRSSMLTHQTATKRNWYSQGVETTTRWDWLTAKAHAMAAEGISSPIRENHAHQGGLFSTCSIFRYIIPITVPPASSRTVIHKLPHFYAGMLDMQ